MKSDFRDTWGVAEQDQKFALLWSDARAIWDQFEHAEGFGGYVPADYLAVLHSLRKLQGTATTFLEWGSGLGVVTMMASRLGFEAYGLEVAPELVMHARKLAQSYAPRAVFATGSFVPKAYHWDPSRGDFGMRTDFDAVDAYDELDMQLEDFDLVYAYPWPDEHAVFKDILRQQGRTGSLLLTYDIHEGMQLRRNKRQRG